MHSVYIPQDVKAAMMGKGYGGITVHKDLMVTKFTELKLKSKQKHNFSEFILRVPT